MDYLKLATLIEEGLLTPGVKEDKNTYIVCQSDADDIDYEANWVGLALIAAVGGKEAWILAQKAHMGQTRPFLWLAATSKINQLLGITSERDEISLENLDKYLNLPAKKMIQMLKEKQEALA